MIVRWSDSEIASLPIERCRELSEQIKASTVLMSEPAPQRRDTIRLLNRLDQRIGQAPASAEERAASAREFLHPTNGDARQRAFDVATNLYGPKEAKRRGYSDPSEAA